MVQREGSNIFDVMSGLNAVLDNFRKDLPEGIDVVLAHDQAESVDERVSQFFDSLLQGLVLVGLLTLFLLGARSAIVVILAIPISVLIGLAWLDIAGFGLQQMSIAGLVIALGLLVDNAIVVTENVSRFLREGLSPREAAAKGASQVGWAVVSGTLTTVLAFVPILGLQTGSRHIPPVHAGYRYPDPDCFSAGCADADTSAGQPFPEKACRQTNRRYGQ